MTLVVHGIPNCDTVRKARAWLAARGVAHEFHDFRKQGLPPAQLARWVQSVGWEPLLNRKGTTWRQLDEALRHGVTDAASAMALMRAQPSVIKRPVVEWGDEKVTVGFDETAWALRLSR